MYTHHTKAIIALIILSLVSCALVFATADEVDPISIVVAIEEEEVNIGETIHATYSVSGSNGNYISGSYYCWEEYSGGSWMENTITLNKELIGTQAAKGTDRAEFNRKASEYDDRFRKAEARLARLQADRKRNLARCAEVRSFINTILGQPLVLVEWDEQLWKIMVSQMTVHSDGRVVFTFRGENTITVRAE